MNLNIVRVNYVEVFNETTAFLPQMILALHVLSVILRFVAIVKPSFSMLQRNKVEIQYRK